MTRSIYQPRDAIKIDQAYVTDSIQINEVAEKKGKKGKTFDGTRSRDSFVDEASIRPPKTGPGF